MRFTAQDEILRYVWSRLDYDLSADATMILNICPSNERGQKILAEELSTDPVHPIEWFTRAETHARYARLSAGPGHIAIEYQGAVLSSRADRFERRELTAAVHRHERLRLRLINASNAVVEFFDHNYSYCWQIKPESEALLGLDIAQLRRDVEVAEIKQHIAMSMRLSEALGVNGTPSFVGGFRGEVQHGGQTRADANAR